ncbi:phosphotriesterase-related protein [Arboricoccus pini]|uniref:Phosphotriesterase-related protein n=1 Tax=Arboricoccus pini TaxID=1963835 RepID=A0A212RGT6_9PROT|nr:phosphotriesterase [Arboricoccus pini]SNB71452.1 phosphotriesterase-related protein [Arboricoccus pini]
MSEKSQGHVGSGQVMTVDGPIALATLGPTLMHEHLVNDVRSWWNRPRDIVRRHLAELPVQPAILGELRMDPFVNLDNCRLQDEAATIEELRPVYELGGRTIVDPTCAGIGRDPLSLRRIARATGLNIVMGGGFYLESSHPPAVSSMTAEDIADVIVTEALHGVDGTDARIGIIGEIGISADFTAAETKSLEGAAMAQRRTGLPLMVHLPGWFRHAHRVLDIVEAKGGDVHHTVLCHMNPSGLDVAYQTSLAERGAFLEFDMIGMDFFYADQGVQCPSDEENARAIAGLVAKGHGERLLLSQDVFLKMMLTRHGGFGYAYVQRHFLPRLARHGLDAAILAALLTDNPRRVFAAD